MTTLKTKYRIYGRRQLEWNTDPRRRCYNGCHFSSEWVWTEWYHLGTVFSIEDAEKSIDIYKRVNPHRHDYKWITNEEHLEFQRKIYEKHD